MPQAPNRPKERTPDDLMAKEVVFVYPCTFVKDRAGCPYEVYPDKPVPVQASVQVHGNEGQQVVPNQKPQRFALVFTRTRNSIKWHDKITFRGITMLVVKVEEKFDNDEGQFSHLVIRALLLSEKESVTREVVEPPLPDKPPVDSDTWIYRSHVVPQSADYEYDEEGKLVRVTTVAGVREYTYDEEGMLTHISGTGDYRNIDVTSVDGLITQIRVA